MSAWPEAVWLKQQIAGLLEIKDLESDIVRVEKEINDFVNDEFFTTIIPEANFEGFNIYNYEDLESQTIDLKNDVIKVNAATVFLTNSSDDDIDKSLKARLKGIPIDDMTNTTWLLDTNKLPERITEQQSYDINFIVNNYDFEDNNRAAQGLQINNNVVEIKFIGAQESDDVQIYSKENGWNSNINLSSLTFTSGTDVTSLPLISWFCLNGRLREGV